MSCEAAAGVTSAGRQSLTFETGLLAFAMFMVVTTEFSVVGLLPALARDFDISLARAGWFVSAFAVASALLGPPLTMLAARCDPRRVLVASTTLFAVGNGLVAATQDPLVLLVVRIVQGGVLPMVASIAIVSATRLAGTGREGWASARVNRGVVATAVIGIPAVAITAERIGWPASFGGLAVLGLMAAALIALRFPAVRGDGGSTLSAQASLLLRARFLAHLALSGVLFAAMFAAYTYIAPLLEAVSSLDGAMVGWMLMGFGVAGIVGNGIAGHVVGRDPTLAAAIGAAILALAMATVAFAGAHPIGTVIVVGVWGAAHTAAFVFCQVGAIAAGRDVPAFAVSLNISICNLGIAIGAVAGGAIVDRFGAGAAGYAGAMIALAALAVAVLILGSRPRAAAKA